MEPFELFLHEDEIHSLRNVRGENRKAIKHFFDVVIEYPYIHSDGFFEDRKGRIVSKIRIRDYLIDYQIDDPLKEVKILEINKVI